MKCTTQILHATKIRDDEVMFTGYLFISFLNNDFSSIWVFDFLFPPKPLRLKIAVFDISSSKFCILNKIALVQFSMNSHRRQKTRKSILRNSFRAENTPKLIKRKNKNLFFHFYFSKRENFNLLKKRINNFEKMPKRGPGRAGNLDTQEGFKENFKNIGNFCTYLIREGTFSFWERWFLCVICFKTS